MTKISKRLQTISAFLVPTDAVVDVGCDHGLLSIYLTEKSLVKKVIASDINQNALNSAIKNIQARELVIETVLSDGLINLKLENINTLIISGMGTKTVLHILNNPPKLKNIKKIIIQANNNHDTLRENLNQLGYYLEKENYTFDKGKWYVTCKFIKSTKKNTQNEIKYGFLDNELYNEYLLNELTNILARIPDTNKDKDYFYKQLDDLKKAISKRE